jgi:hypothetical protein
MTHKKGIILLILAISSIQFLSAQTVNSNDNNCYHYTIVPPQWETFTEQIILQQAGYAVTPAVLETVQTTQKVAGETERLVPVPAVLETVMEKYLEVPAHRTGSTLIPKPNKVMLVGEHSRYIAVPAIYETGSEQLYVPGVKTYKATSTGCQMFNTRDSFITRTFSLLKTPATYRVEVIPAQYGNVPRKRVLAIPGQGPAISLMVPAKYGTYQKKIVKTPASIRTEKVPAQYKTVVSQVVKTPASCGSVPAQYQTIQKKRLVKAASFQKTPIPCAGKQAKLKEIQVPAQSQTVEIKDAQGKPIQKYTIELVPAHVVYEVTF